MKCDQEKHHRRSIRLKEYDYSQGGAYFVTICTHKRDLFFEQFEPLRQIVQNEWKKIPKRFRDVELDEFVVMPNHVHEIIFINVGVGLAPIQQDHVGVGLAPTQQDHVGVGLAPTQKEQPQGLSLPNGVTAPKRATARVAPTTLGNIIGAYKSICVMEWLKCIREDKIDALGKFWQRNYY